MNEPTHDRIDPESTRLPVGTRRRSIQTGAYELIPIPFVDEWLIRKRRREMVAALLEGRGIRIERKALDILAGKPRSLGARVSGLIRGLVIRPLRKILRTVLFWLSVRRAFVTTLESYLLVGSTARWRACSMTGGNTKRGVGRGAMPVALRPWVARDMIREPDQTERQAIAHKQGRA